MSRDTCSGRKGHRKDACPPSLSRRRFLCGLGAAAAGHLIAGCRPAAPTSTPTSAPTDPPPPTATPGASGALLPVDGPNAPVGVARGIYPGRVVWAHNPKATAWDGATGNWWEDEHLDQSAVDEMLSQALRAQTGQQSDAAAWEALFAHSNERRGRSSAGYQPGAKIAIKLNLNVCSTHDYRDNGSFSSPQLACALVRQLVGAAGVQASDITLYDATRHIPDAIHDRCRTPELEGLRFVDWQGGNGRERHVRDLEYRVQWSGDVAGSPTYLPTCVTEADHVINLASLKGHNLAGVTLCAKNHFGTICADLDGVPTHLAPQGADLHGTVAAHDYGWGDPAWTWKQRPMGTYNALVDLMGHRHLGGKTLLFVLDALYVSQDQSSELSHRCRWQSAPFAGDWTASLLLSQDGVAIDSVGLDLLRSEPTIAALDSVMPAHSTADNYLHEAALADAPPSGTRYDPDGAGTGLTNLGVHEHWDNPDAKQYSRNLGTGEGIELLRIA